MPSRPRKPRAATAPPPTPPASRRPSAAKAVVLPDRRPAQVKLLFWLIVVCLTTLTFGLTPYTYNLDDIKVAILFCLFPLPLVIYWLVFASGKSPAPPKTISLALAAYVIVMAVSAHQTPHRWIAEYLLGFTLCGVAIFLAIVGVVRNRIDLERLMLALVLICLGTIAFGLLHRLKFFDLLLWAVYSNKPPYSMQSSPVHGLIYTLSGADREMLSTILNRDFFAAYLNMSIPLALGLAAATESLKTRILGFVTFGLGLLCILWTFSKNDYVIMLITPMLFAGLYFGCIHRQRIRIPNLHIWLLGTFIVFATIIFLWWDLFSAKMKLFGHDELSRNLTSRFIIWQGALGIFRDYPWLGAGPGSFRVLFPLYRNPDYLQNDISTLTLSAHNAYLDYLAETGILGFLGMVTFLGLLGVYLLRAILTGSDQRLRSLQAGLFCGLAGILIANITSPFSRWAVGVGNFFALLGAVAAAINVTRLQGRELRPTQWRRGAGYTLAALTAMGYFGFMYPYGLNYFRGAKQNNLGMMASGYEDAEMYQAAAEYFEKAVSYNPTFITSYYRLGNAYHSLSRLAPDQQEQWLKKAIDAYKRLAKYAPDYSDIHYNFGILYTDLAELALEKKQVQEAVANYSKAAEEHAEAAEQSNKINMQLAAAMTYESLADAYASLYEGARENDPRLRQSQQLRARAAKLYEKVLQYDPKRADVQTPWPEGDPGLINSRRQYGMLLARMGRYEEAADQLHRLLRQAPGDDEATKALSAALRQLKDDKTAMQLLEDLIQSNPLRIDYRLHRMHLYQRQNKPQEAQREAQRILKIDPNQKEAKAQATTQATTQTTN